MKVKKIIKVVVFVGILVSIPVLTLSLLASNLTFGSYVGHLYMVRTWWRLALLLWAAGCIICRVCHQRSIDTQELPVVIATVSVAVVALHILRYSFWGIIRLCDALAPAGNGVFVGIIVIPMAVILVTIAWAGTIGYIAEL